MSLQSDALHTALTIAMGNMTSMEEVTDVYIIDYGCNYSIYFDLDYILQLQITDAIMDTTEKIVYPHIVLAVVMI